MNTLTAVRRSVLLIALLASLTPLHAEEPTTLFIVRHAEKSAPNGDLPLSAEGRSRAARLASMLRDAGVDRIYITEMKRTRETAEPLASQLRLNAETVPVEDVDALVTKLRALPPGSTALIVNHSGTIPKIVEKLGGGAVAPITEDEYDRLLIVTIGKDTAHVMTLRF